MTAASAASAGSDDEQVADDDTDADDLDDLMFELKECETVADVLEVVTDEAASMSPEEASFALYRLAYMARSQSNKGAPIAPGGCGFCRNMPPELNVNFMCRKEGSPRRRRREGVNVSGATEALRDESRASMQVHVGYGDAQGRS